MNGWGRVRRRWRGFDFTEKVADHSCLEENSRFGKFDAVYIPTRRNNDRVVDSVADLEILDCCANIHVIPSGAEDFDWTDQSDYSLWRQYDAFLASEIADKSREDWDLAIKRNFAIWHALNNSYEIILLLDDDIRLVGHRATLSQMLRSINYCEISGGYSIGEFDASLTEAVAMRRGIKRPAFFSGNCLAINLRKFVPYFPNIYNEDWLAIIPAIIRKAGELCGPVIQLPRMVAGEARVAQFQELGEVIADELYSRIFESSEMSSFLDMIESLLDENHWALVLDDRLSWLESLLSEAIRSNDATSTTILASAAETCKAINSEECVRFLRDWLAEYIRWQNKCRCVIGLETEGA